MNSRSHLSCETPMSDVQCRRARCLLRYITARRLGNSIAMGHIDNATAGMGRREDLRLVTGQGRYSADWNLPGQLHAVFLRADRAHAEIVQMDASRALAHPGVKAVLTGNDARDAGFKS